MHNMVCLCEQPGVDDSGSRASSRPLPPPDPNLHRRILREHHFVSSSKEARIHRHPSAVRAHRVAERARVHGQTERHPEQLEAVHASCNLSTGVGPSVSHAIVHIAATTAHGGGRQGERHGCGQVAGLRRCGLGAAFGVELHVGILAGLDTFQGRFYLFLNAIRLDQFLEPNAQLSVFLQSVSGLDLAHRAREPAALRKNKVVIAIQERLGCDCLHRFALLRGCRC